MRISDIKNAAPRQNGPAPHHTEPAAGQSAGSRALVAVTPAAALQPTPRAYRQTAFLAHLLATRGQHPQTRERRRAEPDEALAAYRAAAALARID